MNTRLKKTASLLTLVAAMGLSNQAMAADYVIDSEGKHAFIQFKVNHLGFSYLLGEFEQFTGTFQYDPASPNDFNINVDIDTPSVDSSHAERDKHLRSEDFLHVSEFPKATFVSTSYSENADGSGTLVGDLTLRGVTKSITIDTQKIGMGADPWGKERVGFEGTTAFAMKDFGIPKDLGPASQDVALYLTIEGIKQ
ncbi:YceI family protein [Ostreibacterium oceani]|uniref:YceI family protein n=1 Tax=Ostreibacterium oceani TaxID=2654998 RepID=A0A6N7EVT2_9GAMM|nr:YceI family protein [Ostreibacterium oceani]